MPTFKIVAQVVTDVTWEVEAINADAAFDRAEQDLENNILIDLLDNVDPSDAFIRSVNLVHTHHRRTR